MLEIPLKSILRWRRLDRGKCECVCVCVAGREGGRGREYSRGQKKVPVPFPLYGRSTVFTVPFRFRFLNVQHLHVVSTHVR